MADSSLLCRLAEGLHSGSSAFRHAMRAAVAAGLAFGVGVAFDLEHAFWIVITVIVVMKPSLGASLAQSRDRFTGTIVGAVCALGYVQLFGTSLVAIVPALSLGLLLCVYSSFISYTRFVGFLTFTLILLLSFVMPGSWEFGLRRIAHTALGVGLGLAASFFIWPTRAASQIGEKQAEAFDAIAAYFNLLCDVALHHRNTPPGPQRRKASNAINDSRSILKETRVEPGYPRKEHDLRARLAKHMVRCYRLLISLEPVARSVADHGLRKQFDSQLAGIVMCCSESMMELAEALRNDSAEKVLMPFHGVEPMIEELTTGLAGQLAEMRQQGRFEDIPPQELTAFSSLVWHLRSLHGELCNASEVVALLRGG